MGDFCLLVWKGRGRQLVSKGESSMPEPGVPSLPHGGLVSSFHGRLSCGNVWEFCSCFLAWSIKWGPPDEKSKSDNRFLSYLPSAQPPRLLPRVETVVASFPCHDT